jgi:probable F420-dependent oxidoreductase
LAEKAARVEAQGFASITVGDHLHPRAIAPLTACAVVAGATERVRFGPLVLNNDFRHPVVLAREAAALAELSGGRFELGLGAGFARREYERAGIPFDSLAVRAGRLAESAAILRGLLAGEEVTFVGEHYVVRGESMRAPPPVPVLIGGNSRAVHAAAAEHADFVGLIGIGGEASDFSTAGLERQVERLRELAGPRFDRLELHALVQWHEVTDDRASAAERAGPSLDVPAEIGLDSPYVLIGAAEEIAAQLHGLRERLGLTRWTVFGDRPDLQPADALVPVLELLAPRS